MPAALVTLDRRVHPARGRHALTPDRLHLTGLSPDQRRLIVLLVREIREANGYPTRQDALKAIGR